MIVPIIVSLVATILVYIAEMPLRYGPRNQTKNQIIINSIGFGLLVFTCSTLTNPIPWFLLTIYSHYVLSHIKSDPESMINNEYLPESEREKIIRKFKNETRFFFISFVTTLLYPVTTPFILLIPFGILICGAIEQHENNKSSSEGVNFMRRNSF